MLSSSNKKKHEMLNNKLVYFLKATKLMIKNKVLGVFTEFTLNKAQLYAHTMIEDQLRRTGRVRALIVKGRQQGMSTYIGARFYHKTSRKKYKKTYILTHEGEATTNLFEMIETMRDTTVENLRPSVNTDNAKRLDFDKLNSQYQVGTAGNKAGGRSSTIDYFHGSESAHWKNVKGIRSGVMQAIRTGRGSEVIMESTANGMDEMFYPMCMSALEGKGDYILIFVPWFWQVEYSRDNPPRGFDLSEDDEIYMRQHKLNIEQMWWRFDKIIELKSVELFMQEYPASVDEAFRMSGDRLISLDSIQRARKSIAKDSRAPLIMGVDPARNKDRAVIAFRRGREVPSIQKHAKSIKDDMVLVGVIALAINKHNPVKCFIDCTNSYAIYDRLCELGFQKIVVAVLFSEKASEPAIYINKRVEMWVSMADWLEEGANIPDTDEVGRDLGCMPDKIPTSGGKWKLISKDKIKVDHGFSPDIGDAIALTFAAPISTTELHRARKGNNMKKTVNGLKSKQRGK